MERGVGTHHGTAVVDVTVLAVAVCVEADVDLDAAERSSFLQTQSTFARLLLVLHLQTHKSRSFS